MDVAPFNTGGDGAIGLDRIQIERYVAGLNPRRPAIGPTSPVVPFCTDAGPRPGIKPAAPAEDRPRALRVVSANTFDDQVVDVPVEAWLNGNEITAQFTLHFDPARLSISDTAGINTNPDVMMGALPAGTRLIVNTTSIDQGDIGIVVNFNGVGQYPAITADAGVKQLVSLRFRVISNDPAVRIVPITFNDNVFMTKVSDTWGQSLEISGGLIGGVVGIVK